jgi:hypothetical protein
MKAVRSSMIGGAARARKAAGEDVLGVESLKLVHAPEQALLGIHDAIGIGEIAWQFRKGTVQLAGSLAEIAGLQRRLLGAARLGPEHLTAVDREETGIRERVRQHLPVALDLFLAVVLWRGLCGQVPGGQCHGGRQHSRSDDGELHPLPFRFLRRPRFCDLRCTPLSVGGTLHS